MPVIGSELEIPFLVGDELEAFELEYKKLEKEILGTVANVRYYHLAFPWDSPLSFGVQSLIEYNGQIINDRYQSDLIRVTSISGLDDAEVRDSREARAGKSGEWPYDAFYGGRNLVFTGFIEAGSLQVLKYLEKNLKAAFAPLEESPLKFRWFDVYDPFDDPKTILEYNPNSTVENSGGNYIPLIGSLGNLKAENGLLQWKNKEKIAFLRVSEKRTYCDVQMTIECIPGILNENEIGFILCAKNSENYLKVYFIEEKSFYPSLNIVAIIGGEKKLIKSELLNSSQRPKVGQPFWIRGIKKENNFILQFWGAEPIEEGQATISVTAYLTGEYEELFGNEVLSQVGIIGEKLSEWSFDNFRIESIYPGDVEFEARKLSSISIKDEQTSLTRFKRAFQIPMKTSDFRAFSSVQLEAEIKPTDIENTSLLGRSYPRQYPLKYRFRTSSGSVKENNLLSINNRGSVFVEPILYLYGPGENILIENLTNEQKLEWLGIISEGDYIKIDCKEETIENSLGANYLEPLSSTVEWMKLEPMWNDIYITGSGFVEGVTRLKALWRAGYM
jgi:hypothetical protein